MRTENRVVATILHPSRFPAVNDGLGHEQPRETKQDLTSSRVAKHHDGALLTRRRVSDLELEVTMLNARALSELLSRNSDNRLCRRWYITTPNGTLLAYNKTDDIRDLRSQVAKAALLWQEQVESHQHDASGTEGERSQNASQPDLKTLTMETEQGNTVIRKLQPRLLLVLQGGVPPRKRNFEPRVTAEGAGDTPYPDLAAAQPQGSQPGSFVSSAAPSITGKAANGVLALQRRKLDALAAAIEEGFEKSGFKMPEEGNAKVF